MFSLVSFFGLAVAGILALLYLLLLYQFGYWKRHGIPQSAPSVPFGNVAEFFRQKLCIGEMYQKLYEQTKHMPFVGIYLSFRPVLLVNDPQLIKTICARDFDHFHDRGLYVDERKDPLSAHLFAMPGDKWRYHRSKLTPAFTANRLRGMFPIMIGIGRTLQQYVDRSCGQVMEVRELMSCYTTDIIASIGFGLENDSINDGDNMIRKVGRIVFRNSLKSSLRLACAFFAPKLSEWFAIKTVDQEVEDFFLSMIRKTMDYREKNIVSRQDLMQLLLQLRNSGAVSADEKWDFDASEANKTLTLEQVAAHAFVFMLAGFETSSATISSCLYELAQNLDIQRRLQQEIDTVLASNNGAVTYENTTAMKYLECCLDETLRKHPPVPFLNRECTKDYVIPNTNIIIPRGTAINISIRGIHRDPDYFPDPERFIPDRFSDVNRVGDLAYFPYGYGPRNCMGLRMGALEVKIALVMLLSKFDIRLANEQQSGKELRYDPKSITMMPVGGIKLVFSKREA